MVLNFQNLNKGDLVFQMVLAFLITFLASIFFDYNPRNGGGIFIKISNIFLGGNLFFYLTSFLGFFVLIGLIKENKYNLYLILTVFLGLTFYLILSLFIKAFKYEDIKLKY